MFRVVRGAVDLGLTALEIGLTSLQPISPNRI